MSHRLLPLSLLPAAALACVLALAVPGGEAAAYGWFWGEVSPKADAAAPGRQTRSIDVVREATVRGRARATPAKRVRRVAERWRTHIDKSARQARVSEALLIAIVTVESGGNPQAVSHAGAQGLAQLMPGTAARYGVKNSFDPAANLRGGAAYLSDLLDMFDEDLVLALAAYNAGENAVMRFKGVPPYAETRAYVPKVLSAFLAASELCRHAPRNARRRCVLPRDLGR